MYSIDEMRKQLADIRRVISDLGMMGPAKMLLRLEADAATRTLEGGETDAEGQLPPDEYAYGRICRLSGMAKAAHYLLVEVPACRR